MPATASGSSVPWAGHGLWVTIRMKKYAVKKAPKIITSEMMKSSIPSVGASTREERCAGGGPWCSAWAIDAASIASPPMPLAVSEGRSWTTCSTGLLVVRRTRSIRSARSQPDLVSGKRRDHDVVDAEVLQRVHDRRVGVGVADHPGGVAGPACVQAVEHELAGACAPAGWPGRRRPPAGTTHDEQAAALLSSSASTLALSASSSSSPLAVRLATASVTWNGRPSVSGSAMTCSTGSPVASRTRSIRSRRSQPERVSG